MFLSLFLYGESVSGHIGYYDTDIGYDEFDYFGAILPVDGIILSGQFGIWEKPTSISISRFYKNGSSQAARIFI